MDCPACGLINPPTGERCDCGYDFPTGTMQGSYAPPKAAKARWELLFEMGFLGLIAFVAEQVGHQFIHADLSAVMSCCAAVAALAISFFAHQRFKALANERKAMKR